MTYSILRINGIFYSAAFYDDEDMDCIELDPAPTLKEALAIVFNYIEGV